MSTLHTITLCALLTATQGCSRVGFGHGTDASDAALADVGPGIAADALPADLGTPDASEDIGVDLAPDLPKAPSLVCQPPAVVISDAQGRTILEIGMRTSRLKLVAATTGDDYVATRNTPQAAFGPLVKTTMTEVGSDPTFFDYGGKELVISAFYVNTGSERGFRLAEVGAPPAVALTFVDDATNAVITADMDGASAAVVNGQLIVAHNVGTNGATSADIYLARPRDSADLSKGFLSKKVEALSDPNIKEDDPALDPSGRIIVFDGPETPGKANPTDLFVSVRPALGTAFSAPIQLSNVNAVGHTDKGPLLTAIPGSNQLELFFSSWRSGQLQLMRSVCNF